MFRNIAIIITTATLLTACASSPDDMEAAYVSPLKYKDYDCDQIAMEMDYVGQRTTKLYSQLDKEASNDAIQTGVGMILFWPALFFLEGGDGVQAAEYQQLKGEYQALRQAATAKKCMLSDKPDTLDDAVKQNLEQG